MENKRIESYLYYSQKLSLIKEDLDIYKNMLTVLNNSETIEDIKIATTHMRVNFIAYHTNITVAIKEAAIDSVSKNIMELNKYSEEIMNKIKLI